MHKDISLSSIKNNRFYYRWFSLFFEDYPAWLELTKQIPDMFALSPQAYSMEAQREYDDLLKGTNADVYLPLWASACSGNGDILLDATTLEVIRTYREWGYDPVEMDGNPLDYIGQMLRFLEYMSACVLRAAAGEKDLEGPGGVHVGRENSENTDNYLRAIDDFTEQYVISTISVVTGGITEHSKMRHFGDFSMLMQVFFVEQTHEPSTCSPLLAPCATCNEPAPCHKVIKRFIGKAEPPSPCFPRQVINTAGRNNCGGKCVIKVEVEDGCILGIGTDDSENVPQLRACTRGWGYRKTYMTGKRLRYPMKRIGERGEGRFERITWEEAADITAKEWARIRDAYGPGSRYVNYSTGVSAALRPDELAKRLLNLDGGFLDKYNSYSSACSRYVTPYIYGDTLSGNSYELLTEAKLLILWGHNPVETIFGSELGFYLQKVKEKRVKIIVIDPRQSDSVISLADEWIGIKPSTDSALADAMAYVIWSEGLQDQRFMDTYCIGFDEKHMPDGVPEGNSYEAYLFGRIDGTPKTPAWAQQITGIPAETILRLARDYASAKPAWILPGLGVQRTGNGEQSVRSIALLTCLTGNVGKRGGSAAGASEVMEVPWVSFPTLSNSFRGMIPSFLWTKAVENGVSMDKSNDGLEGVNKLGSNIKMIINLAGNTLLNQHSDINNTIRILKDTDLCEFILCSDVFMTPSARFADILLPAPSFLEEENIAPPWTFGAYYLFNNKAVEPLFESRFEYDFLSIVAEKLGLKKQWQGGYERHTGWLAEIYQQLRKKEPELPEYEVFKKQGGYRFKNKKPYIAYEAQINDPKNNPFRTPSGKIEIFSRALYDLGKPDEIPAIPMYTPCPEGPGDGLIEKFPLQLIGWHTKRRCHSIHDENEWMEEAELQRLWINPVDASGRGITDGAMVEVFNERGRMRVPAHVTVRIIAGVVALPQGAWYKPDKDGIDTRGSINVLTSTRPTPLAKGNPQHTNLVEVILWR